MINFVDLYKELRTERYFSILVHSMPNSKISDFAMKAADAISAKYLNLQDYFIKNPNLANDIKKYSDMDLKNMLQQEVQGSNAIMLDKIDFLIDTWNRSEINAFLNLFNRQWDTFNPLIKVPLITFLETHNFLIEYKLTFENGKSKIYHLSQFNAL